MYWGHLARPTPGRGRRDAEIGDHHVTEHRCRGYLRCSSRYYESPAMQRQGPIGEHDHMRDKLAAESTNCTPLFRMMPQIGAAHRNCFGRGAVRCVAGCSICRYLRVKPVRSRFLDHWRGSSKALPGFIRCHTKNKHAFVVELAAREPRPRRGARALRQIIPAQGPLRPRARIMPRRESRPRCPDRYWHTAEVNHQLQMRGQKSSLEEKKE